MSSHHALRKTNLADRSVQGRILLHFISYLLIFVLTSGAFLLFVEMLGGDPRAAWNNFVSRHGPSIAAALVLAPIFIHDLCRLTNRFAGPMVRLRRAMRELADGNEVEPIEFRKHDFWREFAADFNRVAERLRAAERVNRNSAADGDSEVAPDDSSVELMSH
jgi:hypothetical protein